MCLRFIQTSAQTSASDNSLRIGVGLGFALDTPKHQGEASVEKQLLTCAIRDGGFKSPNEGAFGV